MGKIFCMKKTIKRSEPVEPATVVAKKAVSKKTAEPAVEGARQSRQRRIHAELIAAGTAMFRDRGFDDTTVSDIAAHVGISRRTFFRYFKTKDDLVFRWMDEQGQFVMPLLAARPADEAPLVAMRNTFIALAEHHDSESERVRFLTQLIFDTPTLEGRYHGEHARWESEFVRILKKGQRASAANLFSLQVQVAASITVFVIAIRTWAKGGRSKLLRPAVETAFDALLDGALRKR
jgi:AcrR family transcriptional regulator